MADRPLLITLMAFFGLLFAILGILVGIAIAGIGGLLSIATLEELTLATPGIPIALLGYLSLGLTVAGLVIIIFAFLFLLVARGFWVGSEWSRILALILFGLSAISNIYGLYDAGSIVEGTVVSLVIALLFLCYLTRRHVVEFFN